MGSHPPTRSHRRRRAAAPTRRPACAGGGNSRARQAARAGVGRIRRRRWPRWALRAYLAQALRGGCRAVAGELIEEARTLGPQAQGLGPELRASSAPSRPSTHAHTHIHTHTHTWRPRCLECRKPCASPPPLWFARARWWVAVTRTWRTRYLAMFLFATFCGSASDTSSAKRPCGRNARLTNALNKHCLHASTHHTHTHHTHARAPRTPARSGIPRCPGASAARTRRASRAGTP
jgi:hypothetical protein